MSTRASAAALFLVVSLAVPGVAAAQAFGVGPRMSLVRGDLPSGTPSTRFFGGTIRVRSSKRVAYELAVDFRNEMSDDGLTRVRERPFQGSMLLFLARSAFSPYLLGGYGIYQQTTDTLESPTGLAVTSVVERKSGAHIGFGAEILILRHAAFFLDYRYRFVKFGTASADAEPINVPGSSFIPGLDKVHLSHQGTMLTSGLAFYF
jgi:Outer membrane protein beta-barrel domain